MFYKDYGELTIEDIPMPEVKENELIIKVFACGICGSELETFKSRSERRTPPLIMGHEFAGVIASEVHHDSAFKKGDRVVSHSLISCGHCIYCADQLEHLCETRRIFGMHRQGALAEYVSVPESALMHLPDGIGFREACLTEPLANGVHIYHLTKHLKCRRVAIIGAGPIGLMVQQVFQQLAHSEVIMCDLSTTRLRIAKQLGAVATVVDMNELLESAAENFTSGPGIDLVIDAAGFRDTQAKALEIVRPGGAVVLIGLHENAAPFFSYDIILPEKQVLGTYAATKENLREAISMIERREVDLNSWINYYSLDESVNAFYSLLSPANDILKAVIVQDHE